MRRPRRRSGGAPAPVRLGDLAARERSPRADRRLAHVLAFVAGAANAGGFMAVGTYTSHVTGRVSEMADDLVLGRFALAGAAAAAVAAFAVGAAISAILINWARRRGLQSVYALPLLLEAALLAVFAALGAAGGGAVVAATILLLCLVMGLQNAMITKLSGATIRTTHVTGLITDLGIELGKLLYRNGPEAEGGPPPVRADRAKLALLSELAGLFLAGGVAGALAFRALGHPAALLLALPLAAMAAGPLAEDRRAARG